MRAAILLIVAGVYCWPLLSQVRTAIPGGPTDRDVATMVWNVGYIAEALVTPKPLLRTDYVLVPFGADLRLHTYGVLPGMMVAPLVGVFGAIAAFNVMLILIVVLNGLTMYLLVLRVAGQWQAALVAAACFMLATPVLDQVRVGRPTFASLWIVIGCLLVLDEMLKRPRVWHGAALGVLLVAALLTDFQIALYAALWLAIYGAWRLRPRHALPLTLAAVLAGGVFVLIFYPALAQSDVPRPSSQDMQVYSFRVWDLVDPTVLRHAYGLELGVAAVAMIVWRRWSVWLVGGLLFLVLSLGPALQPTDLPLPFAALSTWPPLAQFRTPYRMAIPAALGLAVVLSMVLARWQVSTRIAVGLVAARLAMALWLDPMQTQIYPSYQLYERLAREPGTETLLEVPFGVRSGLEQIGDGGEVLQIYQSIHGKPLLNGMVARLPASVFSSYREWPALRLLSGEAVDASREDLLALTRWANARYVLVHRQMLSAEQARRVEALLATGGALEAQEGDVVLYRLNI